MRNDLFMSANGLLFERGEDGRLQELVGDGSWFELDEWGPNGLVSAVVLDPADPALVARIAYAICHSQNPGPSDAWNAYHNEWMRDARAVVAALTRGGSS